MERRFDVFLSYNRRDQPAARALAEVLKARGLKVWFDEWELPGGSDWQEAMEGGIERSRAVVVAVGGTGLGNWEKQEVRGALLSGLLPRYSRLLIEGQPGAGKTTFLQFVACLLARDCPEARGSRWGDLAAALSGHGGRNCADPRPS
jgi:TIR domain